MILDAFLTELNTTALRPWRDFFEKHTRKHFAGPHKDSLAQWDAWIAQMPEINIAGIDLAADVVTARAQAPLDEETALSLRNGFMALNPWRKGPFDICGLRIDSEWQSDMKWDRIKERIAPLDGKLVLDVGCGNGYHCFRALGAGADFVLGIDHKLTFFAQNQALLKYLPTSRTAVLPLSIDDMPAAGCDLFDITFSMGVIYHVHSPGEHLLKLRSLLKDGGQAVLETLVIEEEEGEVLHPCGRYACMPNVRQIPSCRTMHRWLEQSGFRKVERLDVTRTTSREQHVNQWGVWQSLEHFLDPQDPSRTVEGHPAPLRAIFLARK